MRTKLLGVVCALAAMGGVQLDANAATQVTSSGIIFHRSDFPGGPTPAVRYTNGLVMNWSGSQASMYAPPRASRMAARAPFKWMG